MGRYWPDISGSEVRLVLAMRHSYGERPLQAKSDCEKGEYCNTDARDSNEHACAKRLRQMICAKL